MGIDLHNLGLLAHAQDLRRRASTRTLGDRPRRRCSSIRAELEQHRRLRGLHAAARAAARPGAAALLRAADAAVVRRPRPSTRSMPRPTSSATAAARHEPAAGPTVSRASAATTRCSTSAASSTCSISRWPGATASTCARVGGHVFHSLPAEQPDRPRLLPVLARAVLQSLPGAKRLRAARHLVRAEGRSGDTGGRSPIRRRCRRRVTCATRTRSTCWWSRRSSPRPARCRRRSSPTMRRASG